MQNSGKNKKKTSGKFLVFFITQTECTGNLWTHSNKAPVLDIKHVKKRKLFSS